MIAALAVHRALHRIRQNSRFKRIFRDAIGDVRLRRKRLDAVTHEFNSKQQSHPANIADDGKLLQRFQRFT